MHQKDVLGLDGEAAAERHLAAKGLRVIGKRVRTYAGEIDLVALDGSEVVFIEVKTRGGRGFGGPEEAVTWQKRVRLRQSAHAWLAERRLLGRPYRIDVVAVISRSGREAEIEHFENAVSEEG